MLFWQIAGSAALGYLVGALLTASWPIAPSCTMTAVAVRRHRFGATSALAAAASIALGGVYAERFITRSLTTELPAPPAPPRRLDSLFWDITPTGASITAEWQKIPVIVPAYELQSSSWYWLRMHFDDWDRVPDLVRHAALEEMWRRYGHVVGDPQQWDRMSTSDWDLVPQPVRAMAVVQMTRYWSGYYSVGARFGLLRGTVTNTMGALIMVESWFEHRAVSTSRSGNRDVGLGQLSDWTRARLSSLLETGRIDFAPPDESGYYNPWPATRMVALWFDLMIDEHRGDLNAAIRSYHSGSPLARLGEGGDYLANVVSKRQTFMRGESRSPTWNELMRRANAAHEWRMHAPL